MWSTVLFIRQVAHAQNSPPASRWALTLFVAFCLQIACAGRPVAAASALANAVHAALDVPQLPGRQHAGNGLGPSVL